MLLPRSFFAKNLKTIMQVPTWVKYVRIFNIIMIYEIQISAIVIGNFKNIFIFLINDLMSHIVFLIT